ncbi:polyhomeotic-like protein 1 isoform X2 [Conger conger]|nr:polyhomeotic-like protein 1 isoform X2 [Conger conger]
MDTEGDQNSGAANGNTPSGGNSRPNQISQMSLYERQAVQALQALQRQPNAAQYFHQLMLQQQISNAQLKNLAAVQQATLAASRQSSSPSVSQASSTAHCTVNLSSSAGGAMTNTRPLGPASSASSTLSQSVLLGGNTAGQGQMYLRVNRRAPLSSQLIFMPGGTATAAVATVAQHQPQQQQQQPQQQQQQQTQQQEVTPPSSSSQSDSDQVQNLALRCVSSPRLAGVKAECPDRKETVTFSIVQQPQQQQQQAQFPQTTQQTSSQQQIQPQPQVQNKVGTYTQPSTPTLPSIGIKTGAQSNMAPPSAPPLSPSSSQSSSLPISQLLLSPSAFCQARAVTTVTSAATATHILVPTSTAPSPSQVYPGSSGAAKPNINTQTLVVQPLQQANANISQEKMAHTSSPVPIQPKTVQGLRLPLQLPPRHPPPILPAPPSNTQSSASHPPPHVPVQLVGARQDSLGNSQALALARARSCCAQDSGALNNSANSNVVTMVTSMATGVGVAGGAGLKSPQTALPLTQISQIHLPTNQSPVLNPNRSSSTTSSSSSASISSSPCLSLPLPADGQNTAPTTVPPTGDSVYVQPVQLQGKPVSGSLKRKSESDVANEMAAGSAPLCAPPLREISPPLSAIDAASGTASPSPPALSMSRGGQGERAPPPQAVVKPQVLTHLIEGFVIQEGAEPFPVTGPVKERAEGAFPVAVPPTAPAESEAPTVMKCEYCEGFAPANQFRGSKRFCSMTCAKRYNVSCSHQFRTRRGRAARGIVAGPGGPEGILRRRGPRRSSSEIACAKIAGRHLPVKCRSESSRSEDVSSCEEEEEEDSLSLSPSSSLSCPRPAHCGPQLDGSTAGGLPLDGGHFLSGSPSHWSVDEVCQFISSLQGCEDLAGQFLSQEIDGQALLLLREEHLMSTMNIKLGPALKICASISNLRD